MASVLKEAQRAYVTDLKARGGSLAILKVARMLEATGVDPLEAKAMAREIVAGEREMPTNVEVPTKREMSPWVLALFTALFAPLILQMFSRRR